jgi:hypothetical protein
MAKKMPPRPEQPLHFPGPRRDLLDVLRRVRRKVMLSGYTSALYNEVLADRTRHTNNVPNNTADGRSKGWKIEVLWSNF